MLGLLSRTEGATHDDRYRYASLVLRSSPLDTLPAARGRDESLTLVEDLTRRGFDVGLALKKDKALELSHLFYVGFHFVEEDHPLGKELLEHVAAQLASFKVPATVEFRDSLPYSDTGKLLKKALEDEERSG